MLGAIIGDIVGSRFEWNNNISKEFEFHTYKCFPTDDSVMSLALAQAILVSKPDYSDLGKNAVECMQAVGRNYPDCGYGGSFYKWMFSENPQPYNSFGNGAAMRVSAAGFAASSLEESKILSKKITVVTHNHPEGIKGAEATAVAVFMAKTGKSMLEIRDYIRNPQPSGYTSDHMIVSTPITMGDRKVDTVVEIQIRTVAMDFWASLEHKIQYKFEGEGNTPVYISNDLRDCARIVADLDARMLALNQAIQEIEA